MPRPGPRPYECIRRAWHSESHQALRGSLTQEIFRIVTEIHSPETRSKKEWQEKLPIVVLRAEEILYSKARTELEYTDVSTLKSRLDDAVNTMIRRTDDTKEKEKEEENGAFMEPCVEGKPVMDISLLIGFSGFYAAALSLGCIPKMNPRGQRSCSARVTGNSVQRRTPSNHPSPGAPPSKQSQSLGHDIPPFLSPREWVAPSQQLLVPRFNGPGVSLAFEQQQQQQQIRFSPAPPTQQFNFRLREQSPAAPPPLFAEDYGYHQTFVGSPRQQQQCPNRMIGPGMLPTTMEPPRNNTSNHDLELSLGPPKHLEVSGSSSSSGSSMSWQSEGGAHHQDCSKRKAVACTFIGGPQLEVTKRQRDFPFY